MSWHDITLSELAHVRSGGGAPQDADAFSDEGLPFVRAGSLIKLLSGTPETKLEKIKPDVASAHGLKLFPPGTVLFAKSGMSATKGYVYALQNEAYVVNHLAALVLKRASDSPFLTHALQKFSPTTLIKDPAYPSIRLGDIEQMTIRAPRQSDERERIASILDQAAALRRKRREALAALELLQQATFFDMFGDPIQNTKGWREGAVLGDFAEIVSGVTKGRKLAGKKTREVPYLAVANVQDRSLNLSAVKTIEATEEEIGRFRLQESDLILTEGGDPDKLGRGTLWHNEISECIHQNHIFRVRLKHDDLQPLFLNWLVGSKRGKQYFLRSAKQTTGIASINMTQLRGFPLLIPPRTVQSTFADRIANIERLVEAGQEHLDRTDDLFAALQYRAFRGEL